MFQKKNVLVAILLLALIPLTASATITRVIGLGGADANYILHDAANPGIWPQLIREYPNLAGGEISNSDFMKAYVNYDFGSDKCALQVSLDKYTMPMFTMGPDFDAMGVGGGYNKLSLIYGRPLGDLLIGVALNYSGKSYKISKDEQHQVVDRDASYSVFGIKLGVSALEKKLDLGLGVDFGSWSDKHGTAEEMKSDGAMNLRIDGRYWYEANDQYSLIPNLSFMTKTDGAKQGDASAKMTRTMFKLGVGNNWTPVDNALAIFEVGVKSDGTKYEYKETGGSTDGTNSEMDIYWRLGFETKIFEWLNGRFGAERNWVSETMEWNDTPEHEGPFYGKPERGYSETMTYLGATTHWNRLYLDLLVQPAFLQNGPNFISGKTTDIFTQVSLKYDFNK